MERESLDRRIDSPTRLFATACAVAVVWGMCLGYSMLRAPIPGPNEPHYLTKARHFWDPDWCRRDFFLESSNPHAVFYALIGWLPERVGFEATALIGRAAATWLLAAGWYALVSAIRPGWLTAVLSMGLLLTFQSLGNLSGEWIVGGVEAKTFSYGLAFLGWGLAMRGRIMPAGFCLGLCFSLHPIVGAWVLLATMFVWMWGELRPQSWNDPSAMPAERSSIPHRLAACGVTAIGMLPGVWACLPMMAEGSSPEADLLQVGRRLKHHLDPFEFPMEAWRYYGLLLVMWALAAWIGRLQRGAEPPTSSPALKLFRRIVAISIVFALAGVALAWGERPFAEMPGAALRTGLLKFYPFRLVDALLPAIVAVELGRALVVGVMHPGTSSWWHGRKPLDVAMTVVAVAIALPLLLTWRISYSDRPASRMDAEREAHWRAICRWIDAELPEDALLWAANENWAVKWYAERAEYVNYKDCPQDAENLLEWQRRQRVFSEWTRQAAADRRFTLEDFEQLHSETGITHILCSRFGPMPSELELLHQAGDFKVYSLSTR